MSVSNPNPNQGDSNFKLEIVQLLDVVPTFLATGVDIEDVNVFCLSGLYLVSALQAKVRIW